jgi:BMFP domain-containing protein YqiC
MQSNNTIFDGLARAMTEAAGMADGVRREVETVFNSQLQRFMADNDFVSREEFEAVEAIALKALREVERLRAEIDAGRETS